MRRLLCLALLAAMPSAVFGAASIVGSAHDFSALTWNANPTGVTTAPDNGGQICKPCHIPHHAFENGAQARRYAPLWNHALDTTTTFTPYTSPTGTFQGTFTNAGQPNGISLLCLSCHDGVLALDQFGMTDNNRPTGFPGGVGFYMNDPTHTGTKITGAFNLGTDLTLSHPFSFTYDAALFALDRTLFNPVTTAANLPNTVPTYGAGTIATDMLFPRGAGTTLECCSCHEPHNRAGVDPLLIKDNAGSALCLTCHNK